MEMQSYTQQQQAVILKDIATQILKEDNPTFEEIAKLFWDLDQKKIYHKMCYALTVKVYLVWCKRPEDHEDDEGELSCIYSTEEGATLAIEQSKREDRGGRSIRFNIEQKIVHIC